MRRITSRQNPIVARFRAAARGEIADVMLLDGVHLVSDALAARVSIQQVAVTASGLERDEIRRIVDRLGADSAEIVTVTPPVMEVLSPVRSTGALVALARRPALDGVARVYALSPALVAIAADVQDPGNLGAIARVAEAAGAGGMVAAGACADAFGWKTLRGSMGSALRLPIAVEPDIAGAIAGARQHGCRIVATTPRDGRSMYDLNLAAPTAVLVGGEGAGLPAVALALADDRVTIPMHGPVESLNAAVTAALVLYEAFRQRSASSRWQLLSK